MKPKTLLYSALVGNILLNPNIASDASLDMNKNSGNTYANTEKLVYSSSRNPSFYVPKQQPNYDSLRTTIQNSESKNDLENVIDSNFVNAIINVESKGRSKAVSPKGAKGLMQLMPGAWRDVAGNIDYSLAFDPKINKKNGIAYLSWIEKQLERHHIRWNTLSEGKKKELIAASYNGGWHQLKYNALWNVQNMPKETRKYVERLKKLKAFD